MPIEFTTGPVARPSLGTPAETLNATMAKLGSAGGGTLELGAGQWEGGLVVPSNVVLRGVGTSTVVKLPASTTAPVIKSSTYDANVGYTGTAANLAEWDTGFAIRNLVVDGNKANNAGAGGYGLALWGCAYVVEDVEVRNCTDWGITSQYLIAGNGSGLSGVPGGGGMLAHLERVKVWSCENGSIHWDGPHDAIWHGVETVTHNLSETSDYGVYFGPRADATRVGSSHFWGNNCLTAVYSDAGVDSLAFTDTIFEGGNNAVVHMNGPRFEINGGAIFAGSNNLTAEALIIGTVGGAAPVRYRVDTLVSTLQGGVVNFANDGGKGDVRINAPLEGTGLGIVGAPSATTTRQINFHDATAGSGGEFMPIRSSGKVGFFGVTPVTRQAAPSDLAGVIALLQAYGLST